MIQVANASPTNLPSRKILDEVPGRTLAFLRGVGTLPAVRGALAAAGYKPADHAEGWMLLHKVSGFNGTPAAAETSPIGKALAEIDAWDEPTFRRTDLTLSRLYPEQRDFVFANLEPATGVASVISVTTFLDRLDALQSDPDRKSTRKQDHAALATLADRGLTMETRRHMRDLLALVEGGAEPPAQDAAAEQQVKELMELRAWYLDWTETARGVVTRRDHLIRLGLAKRKAPKKGDVVPDPVAPAAPVNATPRTPAVAPPEAGAAALLASKS